MSLAWTAGIMVAMAVVAIGVGFFRCSWRTTEVSQP
ncbi:hypothetical protein ALPO108162_06045 [Alicyclobacillus pomorum]|jgi:hypothetical protein